MNSKELGNLGEEIAQKYLRKKRYKILAKNFKRKWGELDMVASPPHQKFWCGGKKRNIVFVEVKTISAREGFAPEDEIDWKKKKQLRKMAQIYLSENKISFESPWQIDIIAVEISPALKKTKIRHYPNAIEDDY